MASNILSDSDVFKKYGGMPVHTGALYDYRFLIFFGASSVDGSNRDGEFDVIPNITNFTFHDTLMRSYLCDHFLDKDWSSHKNVYDIYSAIQSDGHILFQEISDSPNYLQCIIYLPEHLSKKQKVNFNLLKNKLSNYDEIYVSNYECTKEHPKDVCGKSEILDSLSSEL